MSSYTQTRRAMVVTTPLGNDVLLLVGLTGREAISKLFSFQLELLAINDTPVAFDKLLGQKISVEISMPASKNRYFSGVARRVSQGKRDKTFTSYRIDMVPQFWLWTKRVQSRIFQHISVPDILKQMLAGLNVIFELQGVFHPRDYCVQYRESDFDFASRLMEEEGIYYFFTHDADGHKMIVANTPRSHRDVPAQPQVVYEEVTGGTRKDMRVTTWEKTQELRSGKLTLWDHCFELPGNHLQAEKIIQNTAAVGNVVHKLNVADNVKLEVYDYPGAYAQRFDGIDRGGGDNAGDLKKIFEDNARTAEIRMQQEALPGLVIQGSSDCRQFASGHKFALQRHFNADGDYVLTSVDHFAELSGDYRSGQSTDVSYENHFQCIPLALPFRPPSATPKPTVHGTQTAVVTGVPGEEIFCDKYGRVKVQFYWDRQGKMNADSSCWIRVGQIAAGKGFGAFSLPRIGQEVIVAFLEGDPDQPIITGVVYNAENMPPYKLPEQRTFSGHIHRSHHGMAKNASEICFQNQLGSELLRIHAETDSMQQAENNHLMQVGKVHRHEVGQFYHVVVGKPVDVNKAAVGIQAGAVGSGAGGCQPSCTDDFGPDPSLGPGDTEVDNYDKHTGLETDIHGDNTTHTDRNSRTRIGGDDHYWVDGSSYSHVTGMACIFEGMENTFIGQQNEAVIDHNEINGQHVEVIGSHLEFDGFCVQLSGAKVQTEENGEIRTNKLTMFVFG